MSELITWPVEEHWHEHMEAARRQLTQGELALAAFALKRSGQLEFDYEIL